MSQPKVAIIILNWNGWKDTIECLESLYQITYTNYDVIVVDNGSEDESIEKIKKYCEGKIVVESEFFAFDFRNKPIKVVEHSRNAIEEGFGKETEIEKLPSNRKLIIIKNEKNYGFAEGNNVGIRWAIKNNLDYILILNNDTVVHPEFLNELVKVVENDFSIGFVGPKVYYYDYGGRKDVINFAGGRLYIWKGEARHIGGNEIDYGQYDKIQKVDYIEGSCILARVEMVNIIGLLNPTYFAYWEDADWCIRGQKAGYSSVFVPNAKIWHKISASNVGVNNIYFLTRNCFWFMKNHVNLFQYIAFLIYFFIFKLSFYSIIYLVYKQEFKKLIAFWKGSFDGLK